jgi:hypothetical protein
MNMSIKFRFSLIISMLLSVNQLGAIEMKVTRASERPDSIAYLKNAPGQTNGRISVAYFQNGIAIGLRNGKYTVVKYDHIGMHGAYSMIPVKKNGKWGFYSYHKKLFNDIKPIYDSVVVYDYDTKIAAVKKQGQWFNINLQGDSVFNVLNHVSLNETTQKWVYNHHGKRIIIDSIIHENEKVIIGHVNARLIVIREDGAEIYYDSILKIIESWGKEIRYFKVKSSGLHGLVNTDGYNLFPCEYEEPIEENTYSKIFKIKKGDKYALENSYGYKKSSGFIFDAVDLPNEAHQIVIVKMGSKSYFFSGDTYEIFDKPFDEIRRSLGDSYACRINQVFQFYNWKGELKSDEKYDDILFKGNGVWVVEKDNLFGLVDHYVTNIALPVEYTKIEYVKNGGYVIAKKDKTWKLYSVLGKELYQEPFITYEFVEENSILVTTKDGQAWLNCTTHQCTVNVPGVFDNMHMVAGCVIVRKGNKYGIAHKGSWLVEPTPGKIIFNKKKNVLIVKKKGVDIRLENPTTEVIAQLGNILIRPKNIEVYQSHESD